jgi:hypothetical protein
MSEHFEKKKLDLERDSLVMQYLEALEEGDIELVTTILAKTEQDEKLAYLIEQAELALAKEEDLAPEADTAKKVRDLVNKHLTSTFENEQAGLSNSLNPLTIGEVAAKLKAKGKLAPVFVPINEKLLKNTTALPQTLSWQAILKLAQTLKISASDPYWRQFQQTAIGLGVARSHDQAQLAARERKTHQTKKPEA